ncbi:MAG: lamin tail domain-containing protein, partial [Verrucomicrobiota bacterium]
ADEGTNAAAWDHSLDLGPQGGPFAAAALGLEPDTFYYVRALARNVAGDGWAPNTETFMTPTSPPLNVVINEIHYDPEPNTEKRSYIELYNAGTNAVDLSGWRFSDGVDFDFPLGSMIGATSYLLIVEDSNDFAAAFPAVPIGGVFTNVLSNEGEEITLRDSQGDRVDNVDYRSEFPWPIGALGTGRSMELLHPSLDNDLAGSWRSASTLTPGAVNSVFTNNAPPQMRQVRHTPKVPAAGVGATITVKATDPHGVMDVRLAYQVVLPGSYLAAYIAKTTPDLLANPTNDLAPNPDFENPVNWTEVVMVDDGTGDNTYTVTLPPQINRTLVRYRITATDNLGASVRVPYADDPSLNFAYFTYNGVPAYTADTDTLQGGGVPYVYPTNVMRSLPAYILITDSADFDQCVGYNGADQIPRNNYDARSAFNWTGTFFYEDEVYDNIGYRLRQRNARYSGNSKRSMRFRFNRGRYAEFRDLNGRKYPEKWRTLNTQKCRGSRGNLNFGMPEISASVIWELYKVPAPRAHWMHFRVIQGADEAPAGANGQYNGDFFGYYQAMEDYDKRFLDARGMDKGNLYKL